MAISRNPPAPRSRTTVSISRCFPFNAIVSTLPIHFGLSRVCAMTPAGTTVATTEPLALGAAAAPLSYWPEKAARTPVASHSTSVSSEM